MEIEDLMPQLCFDQPLETLLNEHRQENSQEGFVSFQVQLPLSLKASMTNFIEKYPNWDQYRLIQAALAGSLVQNGIESRSITRLYIVNMFGNSSIMNN